MENSPELERLTRIRTAFIARCEEMGTEPQIANEFARLLEAEIQRLQARDSCAGDGGGV